MSTRLLDLVTHPRYQWVFMVLLVIAFLLAGTIVAALHAADQMRHDEWMTLTTEIDTDKAAAVFDQCMARSHLEDADLTAKSEARHSCYVIATDLARHPRNTTP